MVLQKIHKTILGRPIGLLLLIGISVRVLLAFLYEGNLSIFNDSGGYMTLANHILDGDLSTYNFGRTPGYPLVIIFSFLNRAVLLFVQAAMGLAVSVMLFQMCQRLYRRTLLSFFAALVPSVFLHLLFYERALLTEHATVFFLTLSMWYLVRNGYFETKVSILKCSVFGLLAMLVFMVRPMFLILPLFVALFYVFQNYSEGVLHNAKRALFICLPSCAAFWGWGSLNAHHTGYRSITSFSGINLAQNTVFFVHKADSGFAPLRDAYVRKRDSMVQAKGSPAMAVWRLFYELQREEHLDIATFSQRLQPMSKSVILANPSDYGKQVVRSWVPFWKTNIMWNLNTVSSPIKQKVLSRSWRYAHKYFVLLIKFSFLIVCAIAVAKRIKHRKLRPDFQLFVVLFVLGASLGQALVTYGNNARFSAPFFPLIAVVVFQFYSTFIRGRGL